MRILAFCGSNSKQSINQRLLNEAVKLLDGYAIQNASVGEFELPIYSDTVEDNEGVPEAAQVFHRMLRENDALIMASPEHNSMIPAAFKNLIDWASRIPVEGGGQLFNNLPTLLLSTSPGARGGSSNLKNLAKVLPFRGAKVIADHSVGSFFEVMTDDGLKPDAQEGLEQSVDMFREHLQGLKA